MAKEKLKLDCEGCGASLVATDNPQKYHCEKCDTFYKIEFDVGGIKIIKIEEKLNDLKEVISLQEERYALDKELQALEDQADEGKDGNSGCIWAPISSAFIVLIIGGFIAGVTDSDFPTKKHTPLFIIAGIIGIVVYFAITGKAKKKKELLAKRKAEIERIINSKK